MSERKLNACDEYREEKRIGGSAMIRDSQYIWIAPLVAMFIAQLLKPLLIMIRLRRFDWQRMRQSGGMPSSHTALVVALVTELWLRHGGRDPVLSLSIFVALVVMYDAAGVRWQTGRQAAVLNRLVKDLQGNKKGDWVADSKSTEPGDNSAPSDDSSIGSTKVQPSFIPPLPVAKAPWWLVDWPVLNEHVGHKPTEVVGGCVVGMIVALLLH